MSPGWVGTQSRALSQEAAQARYGGLYTQRNVALSGIHTHSGPGGYLQYVLYTITSLGFVRESFDTLVDGVVEVRLGAGSPRHAAAWFPASPNDLERAMVSAALGAGQACLPERLHTLGQIHPLQVSAAPKAALRMFHDSAIDTGQNMVQSYDCLGLTTACSFFCRACMCSHAANTPSLCLHAHAFSGMSAAKWQDWHAEMAPKFGRKFSSATCRAPHAGQYNLSQCEGAQRFTFFACRP